MLWLNVVVFLPYLSLGHRRLTCSSLLVAHQSTSTSLQDAATFSSRVAMICIKSCTNLSAFKVKDFVSPCHSLQGEAPLKVPF